MDGGGGRVPARLAQEAAQAEPQLQDPAGRQAGVNKILLTPSIQKLWFLSHNTPAGVVGSDVVACGGAEAPQQPLHLIVEGLGQLCRHVRLTLDRRLIIVSYNLSLYFGKVVSSHLQHFVQSGPLLPDLQQLLERGELAELRGQEGGLAAARLPAVDFTACRLHGFSLRRLLRLAGFLGVEVVDYVEQEFLRAEVQPGPVNFNFLYCSCWEGRPQSLMNRFESLIAFIPEFWVVLDDRLGGQLVQRADVGLHPSNS